MVSTIKVSDYVRKLQKVPTRRSDSYLDSFDFVAITSCHGKYHFGSPLLSPFILENKSLLGIKHLVGLLNGMASAVRK